MTTRKPASPDLLARLDDGPVICAEGYLFELERRGYLQAGPYVPEVVLEHPDLVRQLHREFVHAGSDVVEAFTYYAPREKLTVIGKEQGVERLNRDALAIAAEVADESGALLAGNICNTNIWNPDSARTRESARAMFEEQVGWAVDAGVDFIIGETFEWVGEAMAALETIKAAGKQAVITLSIVPHGTGTLFDAEAVEGCRRLADGGADVVGFNSGTKYEASHHLPKSGRISIPLSPTRTQWRPTTHHSTRVRRTGVRGRAQERPSIPRRRIRSQRFFRLIPSSPAERPMARSLRSSTSTMRARSQPRR